MHTRTCPHSRCLLVIVVLSYNNSFPRVHDMENTNHCRPGTYGSQVKFCFYRITNGHLAETVTQRNSQRERAHICPDLFLKKENSQSDPKTSVSSWNSSKLIKLDFKLGGTVKQTLQHQGRTDEATGQLGRKSVTQQPSNATLSTSTQSIVF